METLFLCEFVTEKYNQFGNFLNQRSGREGDRKGRKILIDVPLCRLPCFSKLRAYNRVRKGHVFLSNSREGRGRKLTWNKRTHYRIRMVFKDSL